MFPEGAAGVLVHILEEFFDEWVSRVMVHYRWHYPESAAFAANRLAHGDAATAARLADWGPRACRATGTESETQQREAEAEYQRLMGAAEAQLGETAFLLGERPTALDCIVLGGLRAHTLNDPDPAKVMSGYSRVVEWTAESADRWAGGGAPIRTDALTPFATTVLEMLAETYGRFALANRSALDSGARAFEVEIHGERVSYLCRPYPERSRQMVVEHVGSLEGDDRATIQALLERFDPEGVFSR